MKIFRNALWPALLVTTALHAVSPAHAAVTTVPSFGQSESMTMADRDLEVLDVRRFDPLVCTGAHDDAPAFNNASNYAIAHPRANNSGWKIKVPSGLCSLNEPWTINFLPNTSLAIEGDGSVNTMLQFNGGINGVYVTMNTNPGGNRTDIHRQGLWPGQSFNMKGIQFEANTGIVPAAAGVGTNVTLANQTGHAGTAISVIGMANSGASAMPLEMFEDITFTNSKGWYDGANMWAGGFYLQDVSNVRLDHVWWNDTALTSNTTSIPIWYHSTGSVTAGGQGNLNITDALLQGGDVGLKIDGQAIQGVVVDKLATIGFNYGLTWNTVQNTLGGSLIIENSSMSGNKGMVQVSGISTVFSSDNFFYNVSPPLGTNPVFFSASGGTTIHAHGDTFYGPLAGYLASGGTAGQATAIYYGGYGSTNPDPSMFSSEIIAHFDNGVVAGGGPVAFDNITVSSDTGVVPANSYGAVAGTVTGVCYRDSGVTTDVTQHPIFTEMHCGRNTVHHDGAALGTQYENNTLPQYMGGMSLGAPGTTSPAGAVGAIPVINLRSATSSTGKMSGLNAYDVQLYPSGGTPGTSGQGNLTVNDAFTKFNSAVLAPSFRYIGAAIPAKGATGCDAGTMVHGVGSDGAIHDFYCAGTSPTSWVASAAMTAW